MRWNDWWTQQITYVREHRRPSRSGTAFLAVAGVCAALVWMVATVSGGASSTDAKPAVQEACSYTSTGEGTSAGVPEYRARAAARPYQAVIATNYGKITVAALTNKAPCTTNSFAFLARNDFYDDTSCHRVTTKTIFVLQCGDPTGTGNGGPGYSFPDENLAGAQYPAGTVGVAKATANTNGSQFFFSYADPKGYMEPHWTPFGRVVEGMDVLRKIGAQGAVGGKTDGPPKKPVVIKSVTIR